MPGTFNGKTLVISATPTAGAKIVDAGAATNVAGSVVKSLVVACAMFYFPPKKIFCIRISFPSSFTIR